MIFYGYGHSYSMINAVYYYTINKCYHFSPFSIRGKSKFNRSGGSHGSWNAIDIFKPENNNLLIKKYIKCFKYNYSNRIQINGNKLCALFLTKDFMKNNLYIS